MPAAVLAFALGLVLASTGATVAAEIGGPRAFTFVALGDMPYREADDPRFEALIRRINALRPAVSIHVGDTKSGSSPCTDAAFDKTRAQFALFDHPLVYTPGDNEWTDCHRERAGRFDPLERLARLRTLYFGEPRSLGPVPIALERQADVMAEHRIFVENSRFQRNSVLFVQVHVVGSNNGFESTRPDPAEEFFARDRANVAWLDAGFAKARADGAAAMVISLQADLWDIRQTHRGLPSASGFIATIRAIERGARAFGRPVLVVNGDAHEFVVTPFLGTNLEPVANVTRMQVMGDTVIGAVRVFVDPDDRSAPFAFQPVYLIE